MENEKGNAGQVIMRDQKATLVFERRICYPPEVVWKALTDPMELRVWYMSEAKIEGRNDGTIDLVSGPSRLHITGKILVWDPPNAFEHEWKVAPRDELTSGEDAVIRWELHRDGSGTILRLEHRNLNSKTAVGFAPGTHAFLDRLEAQLGKKSLPEWQERYNKVAHLYPSSWVTK